MPRDARAYVWDARAAIGHVRSFVLDKAWEHYEADVLLRSAVERQLEIIGEALNRLSKVDSAAADQIPDLSRIVAFRNILIHGYAVVDDRIVWDVVATRLEALDASLVAMADEDAPSSGSEDSR